jgi:hypothetical protein
VSAVDGGEWSASGSGRFPPGGRFSGTDWIGGWVDHRTGLEAVANRKTNLPLLRYLDYKL